MRRKVHEVLLVSTPYDAWSMEEEGRLAEELVREYRGLNLSSPPRLRWASGRKEALASMEKHDFDLAILVSQGADLDEQECAGALRRRCPELPVLHLAHRSGSSHELGCSSRLGTSALNRSFLWTGNRELFIALIKSTEDALNAEHDTQLAGIRVIIVVEDSPAFLSSILPILYKELVVQTHALIAEGLNEDHRLLAMRARPKVLLAANYEEAMGLYQRYEPCVLGVISDVRYSRAGVIDASAGIEFLRHVHDDRFDIPLLLMSSEPKNAGPAEEIPATFVDKNAPDLIAQVRAFMLKHLGFGNFTFRAGGKGKVLKRAHNLGELAKCIEEIPEDSFIGHGRSNEYSRWLYARAEIELADQVRPLRFKGFVSVAARREALVGLIRQRLRQRRHGLVVEFDASSFEGDFEFLKLGSGSMGGKGRGLAFMSATILSDPELHSSLPDVDIVIPPTLVLCTDQFDEFIRYNNLGRLARKNEGDEELDRRFLKGKILRQLKLQLRAFLDKVHHPLAVRSSGLLEDGYVSAYAGLYRTVMLSNDHPDPDVRLDRLLDAIRLVYASTYGSAARAFARRVGHRLGEERMAVLIQEIAGQRYGNWFHPAVSGVAQSVNYYPFGRMKAESGVATIAAGLGRMVVQGGKAWRFSPSAPELQPQHTDARSILDCAQQQFYSLALADGNTSHGTNFTEGVELRSLAGAADSEPFCRLVSTYVPEEDRMRDTADASGVRVMTFAPLLKHGVVDLPGILRELLERGRKGMGCPVELEFSLDLAAGPGQRPRFNVLQLRPMSARQEHRRILIGESERATAICSASQALGNGVIDGIEDLLFIDPDGFDPANTHEIARILGEFNAQLSEKGRSQVLIGPGRWGSADPWLGIPVEWPQISSVAALIETRHPRLTADPSQGSHFFHNLTTLGIPYLSQSPHDRIDWDWLQAQARIAESGGVIWARSEQPLQLKVNGHEGCGVLVINDANSVPNS